MIQQCAHCELNSAGQHAWNCPLAQPATVVTANNIAYKSESIQVENPVQSAEIKRLRSENIRLQSEVTRQRAEIDLLKPQ